MKAEFEEKEFETQINNELSSVYGFIYGPGQVLENTIGIDVALTCQNQSLWTLFSNPPSALYPYSAIPTGIQINPSYWKNLNQNINRFPNFKFNLFLQHKRPNYLTDKRASEWHYWCQAYYRYNLMSHQQKALEHLSQLAGSDALVGYSCPAFYKYDDLWQSVMTRSVVSHTNFVRADSLTGHHAYTYIDSGTLGAGCSEPISVRGFSFIDEVATLRDSARASSNESNIILISKYTEKSLVASGLDYKLGILSQFPLDVVGDIGLALIKISIFCQATNTRWMLSI